MRLAAITIVLAAGLAHAEGDGAQRLEVTVGDTIEVQVGYMIGYRCDEPPRLVEATMTTRNDVNVFAVKGVTVGKTQCRVGTDPLRTSVLFDVIVKPKKQKP